MLRAGFGQPEPPLAGVPMIQRQHSLPLSEGGTEASHCPQKIP